MKKQARVEYQNLEEHMLGEPITPENNEILYMEKDNIVTLTLNRPDRLNAYTENIYMGLREGINRASQKQDINAIVITGAGRGFCAGADMDNLKKTNSGSTITPKSKQEDQLPSENLGPSIAEHYKTRFGFLALCRKPIIAAINGPCAGIGLVMTLFCDLRFAAAGSKFTTAFAKRGLVAEHGISWILPRLVGHAHAMDILFTGRVFLAEEAEKIGLINKCFSAENFIESTMDYVKMLSETSSPRSISVMKAQVYKAFFQDLNNAAKIGDEEMQKSFSSEDFKEGVSHFVEKRAPKFSGK